MMTRIKTPAEITAMREGGVMLATVLQFLKDSLVPGMSTKDLAELAAKKLRALGARPAFLGYFGFPDILCVSINDEVVHGIPSKNRIISSGDIVSLDFGVLHKGMVTDGAISVIAGQTEEPDVTRLVRMTERALVEGINAIKGETHIGNIGFAIQKILDQEHLGIVREYVGHGVGHELHEGPNIPNYGHKGAGMILHPGMTVAIEPMATLGGDEVYVDKDRWTVKTKDGSLAAHYEHTVLITENGAEILTTLA